MTNLTFAQLRQLAKLKKDFAHDIAITKQNGDQFQFKSDQEQLEILALVQLSRDIQSAIEQYADIIDLEDINHFIMLGTICNEGIARISKNLESSLSKEDLDRAFRVIDNNREKFRQ